MDNKVKSGKEILDDFFANISKIKNVDKGLTESLSNLYNQGKLSDTNVKSELSVLFVRSSQLSFPMVNCWLFLSLSEIFQIQAFD